MLSWDEKTACLTRPKMKYGCVDNAIAGLTRHTNGRMKNETKCGTDGVINGGISLVQGFFFKPWQ